MNLTIKKMETEDEIKGKAYVHWRSWKEAYAGIVDQQYLDELTLDKCESIAYRWKDNIIIAKDGDRVTGFIAYGKCRDAKLENAGEIFALYVLSEYYGCGVGHSLMKAALSQLNEYPVISLWVLKDNQRAIHFYERCGYHRDGCEQTVLLGSPLSEVRMILENRQHL